MLALLPQEPGADAPCGQATSCDWEAKRSKGQPLDPQTPPSALPTHPPFTPYLIPQYTNAWDIGVLYGPYAAPVFFTEAGIEQFFSTRWTVHHNSDRTGIRLIGSKLEWAHLDGGEAGLHPSNIHDNAYAIGTVDFIGNTPIILAVDGPSLGGFVCPAWLGRWLDRLRLSAGRRTGG